MTLEENVELPLRLAKWIAATAPPGLVKLSSGSGWEQERGTGRANSPVGATTRRLGTRARESPRDLVR